MNLDVALFFLVTLSWEEIARRSGRIVSIGEKCDLRLVNWAHAHCWSVKLLCNINPAIAMMCSNYIVMAWRHESLRHCHENILRAQQDGYCLARLCKARLSWTSRYRISVNFYFTYNFSYKLTYHTLSSISILISSSKFDVDWSQSPKT